LSNQLAKKRNLGTIIALALILAAATYLRLVQLGTPSFWVDELNFVYAGKSLLAGEELRFPSGNLNQRAVLYSNCVAWSMRAFGTNEFAARLPSAIFGVLAIAVTYFIGKDFFGRTAGLLSALLLTFSHLAIGWSRLSRMYTLFQLLFIVGVYAFYKGFEGKASACENCEGSFLQRFKGYLAEQGIHWPWLVVSGVVLLVSNQVHELTGIFAASLLAFVAGMFVLEFFANGARAAIKSKYGLSLLASVFIAIVGFSFFGLWGFIHRALSFHPSWARYAYVQDSHYYYYFLTESGQFPLAAFFLIGCIYMITRSDKNAFFAACNFVVPVLLHSFVFSYKVPNYIFQIYPFFVMLAAFAWSIIYHDEAERFVRGPTLQKGIWSNRAKRFVLMAVMFGWLPLTLWFRYALKLPFAGTAGFDGAVQHEDWRGAAAYVQAHTTEYPVLASTVPLTVLYYTGKPTYCLNLAHTDSTLDWLEPMKDDKKRDYYSGGEAISNLQELQQMLARHTAALFVMDTYRLEREQYVPKEVSGFIKTRLARVWKDESNTIQVFAWRQPSNGSESLLGL
jgi:4-amino-4-deoxy-L-arabinose transferase-like glycosyltransferase